MASSNTKVTFTPPTTHEGAVAARINPYQQLRRSVLSCLLWEDEFYESGIQISDRIAELCLYVRPEQIAQLAVYARKEANLRHVSLLLLSCLCDVSKGDSLARDTVADVVTRADELSELLAIHCRRHGVGPDKIKSVMPHNMRAGLALAFRKFSPYSLTKYKGDSKSVKLRDVLFLTHAKPLTDEHKTSWPLLIQDTLPIPDTWETNLSAGADKKATFERLIKDGKLGYLALLRNLRNMSEAGVDDAIVQEAILARKNGAEKVLPFRFVAAARIVPRHERQLDFSLLQTVAGLKKLEGTTVVMVDVSGSMRNNLSVKSDMTRKDAAATLASILNCENLRTFTFADKVFEVASRRGMAGVDAINQSKTGGTRLFDAVHQIQQTVKNLDRLIVITDEQATGSNDRRWGSYLSGDLKSLPKAVAKNSYMINVASAKNGVGYGNGWTHLDGFSESVLTYIYELEGADDDDDQAL